MEPWSHTHAPRAPEEVIGQQEAARRLTAYVREHRRGAKPLLLAGPTGVGKTCLVHTIAASLDREIIEVNASDTRGKDAIASVIGQAAFQTSLFFRGRIILIDEVDGISGTSDRGGIPALLDILPRSAHPVIFTANDLSLDKLKPLRKACETIELSPPAVADIAQLLRAIARAEGVALADDAATGIARRSGGDVRAAITDLQELAPRVTRADLDTLDARDSTASLRDALIRIFRTTSAEVALPSLDAVDEQPETLMHWIDENLPRAYADPDDLSRAYDALAEADRYFGRIRRWQYYRYYVYIYNLLTAGIALAGRAGALDPKRPERFLKLWIAKQQMASRDALARNLAPSLHASARSVRQEVLPYLRLVAKARGHAWVDALAREYRLGDERSWLSSGAV